MEWVFFAAGAGVVLLLWLLSSTKPVYSEAEIQQQCEDTKAKITSNLEWELKGLLKEGRKIEAIKRLRQETDAGLFVSRKVIESLANT